jgi:hypothetical protein
MGAYDTGASASVRNKKSGNHTIFIVVTMSAGARRPEVSSEGNKRPSGAARIFGFIKGFTEGFATRSIPRRSASVRTGDATERGRGEG